MTKTTGKHHREQNRPSAICEATSTAAVRRWRRPSILNLAASLFLLPTARGAPCFVIQNQRKKPSTPKSTFGSDIVCSKSGFLERGNGCSPTAQYYGCCDNNCEGEEGTNSEKDDNKHGTSVSRSSFLSSAAAAAATLLMTTGGADASSNIRDDIVHDKIPTIIDTSSSSSSVNIGKKNSKTFEEGVSSFFAGGSLAATKTIVKYPLDTATVRLQMPNSKYTLLDLFSLFDGSFNGITTILVSNIPAGAIFFAVKDACKEALSSSKNGNDLPIYLQTSVAVAVAQIPYWLVRNPSEVIKARQQAGLDGYGSGVSAIQAFRNVVEGSAFEKLYLGYWENIVYAYPADVIKFVCYDLLKQEQLKKKAGSGNKKLSPLEGALAGAVSTAVAQFVTTPLDVVRNRIMTQTTTAEAMPPPATTKTKTTKRMPTKPGSASSPESSLPPSSSPMSMYFESLRKLGEEEGIEGLFAGATPRVGKAILSGAIQFATYEETKQKIGDMFSSSSSLSSPKGGGVQIQMNK